ncbi:hypothetical protein GGI07_002561 [Coemansia sp. Benny D115]|nr:hypothetical protein GGI07_002561 [Coemansia sp. Benny D115]
MKVSLALSTGFILAACANASSVPVYKAVPYLTSKTTEFGPLIEGAAVDRQGNFYAVNYNDIKPAVGRVYPKQGLFFQDVVAENSWFNGVRFHVDPHGRQEAYLGDVVNHRVVRVRDTCDKEKTQHWEVFCQDPGFLQPNDLAIAHSTGRVFLTGMRFTPDTQLGDGDLWTCGADGRKPVKLGGLFYRTNGVELSPDEKTLYVSEAINKEGKVVSNAIHAFDVDARSGSVSNRRVFVDFNQLDGSGANDVDGMRTDVLGNLYVARWGAGKVAKISPQGKLLAYIELSGIAEVTNLEFAGPRGKDLFVVGACKDDPSKGCVDRFTGSTKGRAYSNLQKK